MKILCLQLARLGDILNTRPSIRALLRTFPQAEVVLLVRKRFASACVGLGPRVRLIMMDSEDFLKGLADDEPRTSLEAVRAFLGELIAEDFDQVINLSFSPLSSWIVSSLERSKLEIEVKGYSRYQDRTLRLSDPVSAYFFAQVGVRRSNRIHLIELFAGVCGVQLLPEDWNEPNLKSDRQGVVIHVGASEVHKRIPSEILHGLVLTVLARTSEQITLIGTPEDGFDSDRYQIDRIENLIGKTRFEDLFGLIQGARLLIGADSAPIHVATLTNTPTLNVSYGDVNFWETGPRAAGSRIFRLQADFASDLPRLQEEIISMLNFDSNTGAEVFVDSRRDYFSTREACEPFDEQLLKWLYFQGPIPLVPGGLALALRRLQELGQLGLEQVYEIERNPGNKVAAEITSQVDRLAAALEGVDKGVGVLVRYFQTRRCEIGPGDLSEVLSRTKAVYEDLIIICHQLQQTFQSNNRTEAR